MGNARHGYNRPDENTPSKVCLTVAGLDYSDPAVNGNVAGLDGNIPAGELHYILYTEESAFTRFSNTNPNGSDNFLTVIYSDANGWETEGSSDNSPREPVIIRPSDFLITQILTSGEATPFTSEGVTNGIPHIPNNGGLTISNDTFNGSANNGELEITGGTFGTGLLCAFLQLDGTYLSDNGESLTVDEVIEQGYELCPPEDLDNQNLSSTTDNDGVTTGISISGGNSIPIVHPDPTTTINSTQIKEVANASIDIQNVNDNDVIDVTTQITEGGWVDTAEGFRYNGSPTYTVINAHIKQTLASGSQRTAPILGLQTRVGTAAWVTLTVSATGYMRNFGSHTESSNNLFFRHINPPANSEYRLTSGIEAVTGAVNSNFGQFDLEAITNP